MLIYTLGVEYHFTPSNPNQPAKPPNRPSSGPTRSSHLLGPWPTRQFNYPTSSPHLPFPSPPNTAHATTLLDSAAETGGFDGVRGWWWIRRHAGGGGAPAPAHSSSRAPLPPSHPSRAAASASSVARRRRVAWHGVARGRGGCGGVESVARSYGDVVRWGHGGGSSAFSSCQGAASVMDCGAASEAAGCVTSWVVPPPARPLARCLQWPRAVERPLLPCVGSQAWNFPFPPRNASLASWRWMQRTCHERTMLRCMDLRIHGFYVHSAIQ